MNTVTIEKIVRDEVDPIEEIEKRLADGQIVKSDLEAWLHSNAVAKRKDTESVAQAFSRLYTGPKAQDPVGRDILHKSLALTGLNRAQQQEVAKATR